MCKEGLLFSDHNVVSYNLLVNAFNIYVHCISLQVYNFKKVEVTDENIEDVMTKMVKFGVTIQQYKKAFELPEIVSL